MALMPGPAASSDLDALGITRAGQAAKTRATSWGSPLRAHAGGQEQRLRAGQVELGLDAGRPDHGADWADLSRRQPAVQFADLAEQPFIDLAAVAVTGGLDSPSFRVGGTGDDQQAAPGLVGAGDEGVHGGQPEIRVNGDGVGLQRSAGAEEGLRIGLIGTADVTALDVQDDQQPRAPCLRDEPAERPEPPPAMALEEGGLRFHQSHRSSRGLKHDIGEPVQPIRLIAQSPRLEQGGGRVQAPHQRPRARPRDREPGGERVSHGSIIAHRPKSGTHALDRHTWSHNTNLPIPGARADQVPAYPGRQ